jgi:chromosome partitioning protein
VRYWSLNALAIADVFFLTLKMGDIDIEGTKKMVSEIYHSFTEYGSKSFLIWNKVAGYCMPQPYKKEEGGEGNENSRSRRSSFTGSNANADNYSLLSLSSAEKKQRQIQVQDQKKEQIDTEDRLSDKVGMKVISTIPCYCDIQFSKKEFLTAIHVPHPFSEKIESLVNSIHQELVDRNSE